VLPAGASAERLAKPRNQLDAGSRHSARGRHGLTTEIFGQHQNAGSDVAWWHNAPICCNARSKLVVRDLRGAPPHDVLRMVEPAVEARPRRLAIERHNEIAKRIRRLRGPVAVHLRLEQRHP
jgi:hypothetical protein